MTERRNEREPCSAWPPAASCTQCKGAGGWYKRLGPVDWDWTTCQSCRGTGDGEHETHYRAQVMGPDGWVDGGLFTRRQDAEADAAELAHLHDAETQVVIEVRR